MKDVNVTIDIATENIMYEQENEILLFFQFLIENIGHFVYNPNIGGYEYVPQN